MRSTRGSGPNSLKKTARRMEEKHKRGLPLQRLETRCFVFFGFWGGGVVGGIDDGGVG